MPKVVTFSLDTYIKASAPLPYCSIDNALIQFFSPALMRCLVARVWLECSLESNLSAARRLHHPDAQVRCPGMLMRPCDRETEIETSVSNAFLWLQYFCEPYKVINREWN